MAAAATLKVRAGRGDAVRRGSNNRFSVGAREAGLFFENGGFHFFACNNKRKERCFATPVVVSGQAREAISAVNQFFDGKPQELI
jgi:hypothetical protein